MKNGNYVIKWGPAIGSGVSAPGRFGLPARRPAVLAALEQLLLRPLLLHLLQLHLAPPRLDPPRKLPVLLLGPLPPDPLSLLGSEVGEADVEQPAEVCDVEEHVVGPGQLLSLYFVLEDLAGELGFGEGEVDDGFEVALEGQDLPLVFGLLALQGPRHDLEEVLPDLFPGKELDLAVPVVVLVTLAVPLLLYL